MAQNMDATERDSNIGHSLQFQTQTHALSKLHENKIKIG